MTLAFLPNRKMELVALRPLLIVAMVVDFSFAYKDNPAFLIKISRGPLLIEYLEAEIGNLWFAVNLAEFRVFKGLKVQYVSGNR